MPKFVWRKALKTPLVAAGSNTSKIAGYSTGIASVEYPVPVVR
jgi:hypothetical protein